MVHQGVFAIVALAALSSLAAAIDFRPQSHTFDVEGGSVLNVAFVHGTGAVTYSPPNGWRVSGTESQLQLVPPSAQSEAQISRAAKADAFTPEAVSRFKKELVALLPQEADSVEWAADRVNPMSIGGKETYEVELTYTAFGKRFKSTLLVCNLGEEQLRFRVVAPAAVFVRVYEPFRQSLYSLTGLK